ncbi:MAG: sulfatase-like hydrolase/transferase [Nannocystaceae bacterium]
MKLSGFLTDETRSLPSPVGHAVLSAVLFGVLTLGDYLGEHAHSGLMAYLQALGVGMGVGAIFGACLGVGLRTLSMLPAIVRGLIHTALGGVLFWWLASGLGVWARLGGKDHRMAVAALAASVVAGLGLTIVGLGLQPSPTRSRGPLAAWGTKWRVAAVITLFVGGAVCIVADRLVEPAAYPRAHAVLRIAGYLLPYAALLSLSVRVATITRPKRRVWLAAILLTVAVPLLTLDRSHEARLEALLSRPYPGLSVELLRRMVDPDLDGYSAILGGGDCDSWRADVNPGVPEIPNNGIDDNCRLGDRVVESTEPADVRVPDTPAPTSVVLVTVDTLSVRHMSMYGGARRTTPELERWVRTTGAVKFDRAYTSGGWTSLAISSMLRGLYPRRLRWTRVHETNQWRLLRVPVEPKLRAKEMSRMMFGMPMEDPRKPLAFWLQRRGMFTIAVVNDGQSEFFDRSVASIEGFDIYQDLDHVPAKRRNDAAVTDAALKALRQAPDDQPFFLWVHYFGPHAPSHHHAGIREFGKSVADAYAHEILYMDREVTRLLRDIGGQNRSPDVAFLVTADHGEVLTRRGRGHGRHTREAAVQIPMLLAAPGLEPNTVRTPVSLVDVMPTVLGLTETPAPAGLDGIDLTQVALDDDRVLFLDTWQFSATGELSQDTVVAFDGDLKLSKQLLNGAQTLRRQGAAERLNENLLGTEDDRKLRQALDVYLEENGPIDFHD